jgi:hypothetical protein
VKLISLLACAMLALALAASPATAKKKKKKPPLGPVVTVTATGNTASVAGEVSTAAATCPAGTTMIGGGFSAPLSPGAAILVYDTYRSGPQSWTASGILAGGTAAVKAFGYCRKTTKQISDVTATAVMPAGFRESATTAATCPAGTQLVSGGFQSTRNAGTTESALPVTNFASAQSTWTVTGTNNGLTAQTITAHAYCMSGIRAPSALTTSASPTLAQLGTTAVTSPACPVAKKPKKKKGKKRKKKQARLLSAGGFSTPATMAPNPVGVITDSIATTGGWSVTVLNATGPTGPVPVTSQGICV